MRKSDIRKAKEMIAVTNNIQKVYVRKLVRLRKNALNKALKLYEQTQNIDLLNFIEEPYLPTFFRQMYTVTANKVGTLTASHFGLKSDIKKQGWYKHMESWIEQNTGDKINTVHDTFIKDIKEIMKEQVAIAQETNAGITEIVKAAKKQMYNSVDWKVRRIVNTEVLSASSVAQNESVKDVGLPYTKTWIAAMINTRHSHKAMHGKTLENTHLFLLPDGSKMEFPRDSKYGASAGEIINCQCMVVYGAKRSY
jgi:D-Tyr-tRNAtyr deacylase